MVWLVNAPAGSRPPHAAVHMACTVPVPAAAMVVVVDGATVVDVVDVVVWLVVVDVVVLGGVVRVVAGGWVDVVVEGGGGFDVEVVPGPAVVVEARLVVVAATAGGRDPPASTAASVPPLTCHAQAAEPTPTSPASAARNWRRDGCGAFIGPAA